MPEFIDETREYLLGKLLKGDTLSGEEAAVSIKRIKGQLPSCVKKVLIRADAEFFSWETVSAAMEEDYDFIIAQHDKRADVENLVGEAKREGLEAIPSAKFKNGLAFFQVVMLAYNIWRYLKMMAHMNAKEDTADASLQGVQNNTIRIARLKLMIAS